ncbi:PREDICTED: transcription factor bHLH148 [Tarenaya hassleriana]|uniref:transcription factor bHLH148 n=1 Tax=Tarenaya hassleriana TaxID=28532 RepID=UPI00053C8FFF|nr:PREDICTED: transcription factor bHLH148 [Tarenaya hassleriana]XP_010546966.1 PREDICTED: transcription factor bHLH148 [Tarenaya hassleriana]
MASLISNHESTMIPNPSFSDSSRKSSKKKKPSAMSSRRSAAGEGENHVRWRSDKQQRIYSAKLIQAMRQVRQNSATSPTATRRSKAVREAADRALAVAARGRTIWSRAILANRIKLKFRKQKRPRPTVATVVHASSERPRKVRVSVVRLKRKSLPAVQRNVKVLGRLVPGCRKQTLPVILEEATDYIQALEVQIRAMSTLAELLSGSTSGSALPPS